MRRAGFGSCITQVKDFLLSLSFLSSEMLNSRYCLMKVLEISVSFDPESI